MCIFCAAIPVTMAVGLSAKKSQQKRARMAEAEGKADPRRSIPAGPATTVVVAGLVIASVVYHTHFIGPL